MSGMWERWARRCRLVALGFLAAAGVSVAVAVLLFSIGHGYLSGALIVTSCALLVHASFELWDAYRYAKLEV